MVRTNFYFPAEMILRLKKRSQITGLPMSELIRRAVDTFLTSLEEAEVYVV